MVRRRATAHAQQDSDWLVSDMSAPLMNFFRCARCGLACAVFFCLLACSLARAQTSAPSSGDSESSFIAAFRTSAHVQRSSPAVFNEAVDQAVEFLRSSDVALANDPLRDPSSQIPRFQEDMSRDDLLASAKYAGATHLLVITVDRPVRQWLKVTLESYDLFGKMLWRESASYSCSYCLNSKGALPEIMKKLGKQLSAKVGKPGLPLVAASEGPASGQQPVPPTVAPDNDTAQTQQAQVASTPETAKVHVTSSPTHGEIYVDGKFFGNAPSDITLPAGEHIVKITIGGKEWSRTIEITPGEITVHADVTEQ